MNAPADAPKPAAKLLGSPKLKLRVGLASAALLATGLLIAPGAQPTSSTLSAPAERIAPLLEEARRREPAPLFQGLSELASQVAAYSVAIPTPASVSREVVRDYPATEPALSLPGGFGVAVSTDGDVLTHAAALEGRVSVQVVTASGLRHEASLRAYEPGTGLTLLRLAVADRALPVPEIAEQPDAGALVVAAARYQGRAIAAPLFVTSVGPHTFTLSEAGASLAPGTPVYDVDGRLVGVVVVDGPIRQVFAARRAVDRLFARAEAGATRQGSIGVAFQPLTGALTRAFGERGALVSDVVVGGPAEAAGLRAGDVLLAIGGGEIRSTGDAQRAIEALEHGAASPLQVLRDARRLTLPVTASSAFEVGALVRAARPAPVDALPEMRTLLTPAALEAGGIPPDARVLRINARPIASRSQALRELGRPQRPTILYLQHEGVRFFAVREQP